MIRALWSAATGMDAQARNIDVIANNLANVNTIGFKKSRADFADLFYQELRGAGSSQFTNVVRPTGIEVGHGVSNVAVTRMFSMGDALETKNPLDCMLVDEGTARTFFAVQTPTGVAYTRDGGFVLSENGDLVTKTGLQLQPPITGIPTEYKGNVIIGTDGKVQYLDSANNVVDVGQIQVATFINPSGLRAIGGNLLVETPASGAAQVGTPGTDQFAPVESGFLEYSNVQAVEELINMIKSQRAYELNSRSVQTADEMLQTVSNLKR